MQRLLPLRDSKPYSAALDMRFASESQPDTNPLLPYVRFRVAKVDWRPPARASGKVQLAAPTPSFAEHYSQFSTPPRLIDGIYFAGGNSASA